MSSIELIEGLKKHTQSLLHEIKTCFHFNNHYFKIDRNEQLEILKKEQQQILILSGVHGVGKTALIKELHEQLKGNIPFFLFKATEFELRNINDLFANFGFYNFVKAFEGEKNKIIVIDSAERLLELKNSDPFKEFLLALIEDKWQIIFTIRNNYLEDLSYRFLETYNIVPLNISINNLKLEELYAISEKHTFQLPNNEKLLELIRNPLHLNEYLRFYNDKEGFNYFGFKNKLWNKEIKKTNHEREMRFLQIAFEMANKGQFFIDPSFNSHILNELVRDGILGYETAGYFIRYDIYKEWALEFRSYGD